MEVRRLECLDFQRDAAEAKADTKAKYLYHIMLPDP